MKLIPFIGGCLIALIGLVGIILLVVDSIPKHGQITEVDCYDRYRNKIEGLTCTQTYDAGEVIVFGCMGIIITFGVISCLLIAYGLKGDSQ